MQEFIIKNIEFELSMIIDIIQKKYDFIKHSDVIYDHNNSFYIFMLSVEFDYMLRASKISRILNKKCEYTEFIDKYQYEIEFKK